MPLFFCVRSSKRTRMKHCHPLVDKLKDRFTSENVRKLVGLTLLLCLVVTQKRAFFRGQFTLYLIVSIS